MFERETAMKEKESYDETKNKKKNANTNPYTKYMLAVCVCVPHRLMHDIILLRLSSIQSFIFFFTKQVDTVCWRLKPHCAPFSTPIVCPVTMCDVRCAICVSNRRGGPIRGGLFLGRMAAFSRWQHPHTTDRLKHKLQMAVWLSQNGITVPTDSQCVWTDRYEANWEQAAQRSTPNTGNRWTDVKKYIYIDIDMYIITYWTHTQWSGGCWQQALCMTMYGCGAFMHYSHRSQRVCWARRWYFITIITP